MVVAWLRPSMARPTRIGSMVQASLRPSADGATQTLVPVSRRKDEREELAGVGVLATTKTRVPSCGMSMMQKVVTVGLMDKIRLDTVED